jgi:hypothetical protein
VETVDATTCGQCDNRQATVDAVDAVSGRLSTHQLGTRSFFVLLDVANGAGRRAIRDALEPQRVGLTHTQRVRSIAAMRHVACGATVCGAIRCDGVWCDAV